MPLSREGLWVGFYSRGSGTALKGAVPLSQLQSEMLSGHPSFHPWELLASRESLLKCDCAQTHTLRVFPRLQSMNPQASFSALPKPQEAQSGSVRSLETQAWQARAQGEVQPPAPSHWV